MLRGVFRARNRRTCKIGEWMSDEFCIHAAFAVELFFKREDDKRLVNIFAQQLHPSLPPGPELRTHIIDHGNAALLHFPGNPPVEGRRINHDGEIGFAAVGFGDEPVKKSPDSWQMTKNFCNADDRKIMRVNHDVAAGGAHLRAADTEEGDSIWRGSIGAQSLN